MLTRVVDNDYVLLVVGWGLDVSYQPVDVVVG